MGKSIWRYFDLPLFLAVITTAFFGVMMIRSAAMYPLGNSLSGNWITQGIGVALGLVFFFLFARINYHVYESFNLVLYIVLIGSLLLLFLLGFANLGAERWIKIGFFQWQPSETAKPLSVLILARFYSSNQHRVKKLTVFLFSLALIGPAILLVFAQPDLGTSLVIIAIWLIMTWCAGADRLHLLALFVIGIPLVVLVWNLGTITGGKVSIFKSYQQNRLLSFLNPESDAGDTGYQLIAGRQAIINGGLFGEGYTNGTSNRLNLIPESHTDFIFSVVGEEFGFIGCVAMLGIMLLVLLRISYVASIAHDAYGRNICIGVLGMLAFQMLINVGMNVGLMPVTGIPLPLVSYGLSSCWTTFIALGVVESVAMRHRHDIAWYYRVGPTVE
jgi:rod shape determining protein RodA